MGETVWEGWNVCVGKREEEAKEEEEERVRCLGAELPAHGFGAAPLAGQA